MPADATGLIVVGASATDSWGSDLRQPLRCLYLIHFSTPVVADEASTLSDQWAFPHSMVMRPDPSDFAYDLALLIHVQEQALLGSSALSGELTDWPVDPRDDDNRGFERRTALHDAVATVSMAKNFKLQLVAFEDDPLLGPECVSTLVDLGFSVERYDRAG